MAGKESAPKTPPKKGHKIEDESRRGTTIIPRAPKVSRRVVNPRENRKGR